MPAKGRERAAWQRQLLTPLAQEQTVAELPQAATRQNAALVRVSFSPLRLVWEAHPRRVAEHWTCGEHYRPSNATRTGKGSGKHLLQIARRTPTPIRRS
jgi:ABC-type sulfate transport system substrate-binding protein